MKLKPYSVLFALALSVPGLKSQTNSVALKDASNTLISSHTSITDAYSAIPGTLTQGYIIEIGSAYNGSTETYPITFTAKTGASATNTITLRPAASVTAVSVQTTIASAGNGVFKLDDADYVVIDGRAGGTGTVGVLTFNNTSTAANGNTIVFINGACNNIVRYCNINNSTTGNTGRGVLMGTSASNTTGNSDNLFIYNHFTGGRYVFNSNGTAANSNTRNRIFGCTFKNGTFASIWAQAGTAKITIDSCQFFCTTPTGSGTYFGIVFDSQKDSAIIKNNRLYDIQDLTTGVLRYIHVRSIAASSTNFTDIRNNFFSMMTGNASLVDIAMIELEGTAANARVVNNSFRIGGVQTAAGTSGNVSSAALHISSTNSLSTYEIKNNLFVNERTGGTGVQHVCLRVGSASPSITINYNTYNSTSGDLVRWVATAYNSLAAYQAVVPGGEPNANTAAVQYVSANNLHLSCTQSSSTTLQAPQIPGVTSDIDNQSRGTTVFRGADEINGAPPTVSASSGTICQGTSYTITGSGAASYLSSGGSMIVSPNVTTTYTVTGIAANGCQAETTSTVVVNPSPTVTVNSGSICAGSSFTITPSGAVSYVVSGGNNVVSPLSNTDYTVTGTDANGCGNSSISSVTVHALPTLTVNNGTICAGSSFTILPSGALSYTVSGGNSVVSPLTSTDYTVTGADANGCEGTAVSSVIVNALPAVAVNSGAICIGNSFTLTPSGAINYTISGGNTVVSPTSDASYTVTGSDANGCENTTVSSVTVNALPVISANSGVICNGASFTIVASGAVNYTYSGGSNVVSPTTTTSYTVTGADANGCQNTAQSSVTVNPLPVVSMTATPNSVCVNGATIGLAGSPAGGSFSGVNVSGNVFTPASTGSFSPSYSYTDATTGCSNSSAASVVVELCSGINKNTTLAGLSVYPNPSSSEFTVELANGLSKTVLITDLNGRTIEAFESKEDTLKIDLSNYSNGIYFVKVSSGSSSDVIRLIKQ